MIYNIIISPIELIIDWCFNFIINKFPQVGIFGAIIGISTIINFLALPLYNIADSIQANERELNKKMQPQLNRIKTAFKGDEQFMMIQTYYRECNYHPLYVFRSSLSILIEIPFFIAAYHYLSHCELLNGAEILFFRNLAAPDKIITFGNNFSINILPVLMTLINLISGFVYAKDSLIREKIQIVVIPFIFLALLYNSPSGLVIYWILNNLFSLFKNIVLSSKNPGKLAYIVLAPVFCIITIFAAFRVESLSKKCFLYSFACIIAAIPYISKSVKKLSPKQLEYNEERTLLLILSGLSLAILSGLLIPSRIIATSPEEFSYLGEINNPLTYILSSLYVFIGFFVFWPLCIFKLFNKKVKFILPYILFFIFVAALLNVFIFTQDYGIINLNFRIQDASNLQKTKIFQTLLPLVFSVIILFLFYMLENKKKGIMNAVVFIFLFSEIIFSFIKIHYIQSEFKKIPTPQISKSQKSVETEISPIFHLSKTEKNVVILFLDRAAGSFFPHIINELPELRETFNGFTYYPNTVSFSTFTLPASPAMLAGYEYTQEEMNKRPSELLKDKHNEALKVAPTLFNNAGYDVVVSDPIFPNYVFKGEDIFSAPMQNVKCYELFDKYSDIYKRNVLNNDYEKIIQEKITIKEIKNFSILLMLFPALRSTFYFLCRSSTLDTSIDPEIFIATFAPLYYLDRLTDFESQNNNYIFFGNDATHSPIFLDKDYEKPLNHGLKREEYFSLDTAVMMHYDVNCASMKAIGKWLNYLRDNNCYDNTRIIIVSDHGPSYQLNKFMDFKRMPGAVSSGLNCLLLYKDFNSNDEIKTDYSFMTNADTLFLSKKGLDISDVNPFTGKLFQQNKTNGVNVYLPTSQEWNNKQLESKKVFTLDPEIGWHIQESIFEEKNWRCLDGKY